MTKISATIVADSKAPSGDRLTTMLVTFPRFILAELNTHRMLSKNSASSRAIPFNKMVEAIENNPFIPIAFQKTHSGMQGNEYLTGLDYDQAKFEWLEAKDRVIEQAQQLDKIGTTKQLCNRLLEPFMWHTVLISGTEWENFFSLRCPQYTTPVMGDGFYAKSWKDLIKNHSDKDNLQLLEDNKDNTLFKLQHNKGQAEIHMMALAEAMWDAMNESTPKELKAGDWHIPFEDKISSIIPYEKELALNPPNVAKKYIDIMSVKVTTAMAAHTSYTLVGEEKEKPMEKWIEIHDKLVAYNPPHSSPMEHCARVMTDDEYYSHIKGVVDTEILNDELYIFNQCVTQDTKDYKYGWCRNYRGFIQYREILENKQ